MPDVTQTDPPERDRIRTAFAANPRKMTLQLCRELGVCEEAVIRALPDGSATELDVSRFEELVRAFEPLGNVHVIVSNSACTMESFGTFGNFSTFGDYFNVQTKTIDMHVRAGQIGSIFAVEKPGHMDGVNTLSFQFYDRAGSAAFKVFLTFGGSTPKPQRVEQFNDLRDRFRRR